ncbi:MAG: 1-deoxy-D-xylulose-5-phosphate reductoisomerase [Planctomycetes bacterium]|nr:1-deoxy-D-xylulose-5-phosphate reductoisomerase [Planctomycetota bacterium]
MIGVCVLGSTGSVGRQALDVIRELQGDLKLVAVSGHSNWRLLLEQVRGFRPSAVVVTDPEACRRLAEAWDGSGVDLAEGAGALETLVAREDVDVVVVGITGAAALPAVVAAARAGKRLALANKESLVMAGAFLMPLAQRTGAQIIPVDSEHSAVFQCLLAGGREEVRRITLTASGGPFRLTQAADLARVTPAQALRHPTWEMGRVITVNSATLMNKALEVIEARWLFDLAPEQIDVLVHPQSIVHSMVEFHDGSVMAQLGLPDMKVPIQFALTYPRRRPLGGRSLDLASVRRLEFERPDLERFPAVDLAYRVIRMGGTAGAVLNAANEEAVLRFLDGRISFLDISRVVAEVLGDHVVVEKPGLEDVLEADGWARLATRRRMAELTLESGTQARLEVAP